MSNTSERRGRREFTDEFEADAVALVAESGGQVAKVAKELGIYDSSLGNWVRQAREQAVGAPTVEERAEIRELKKELDRVTRERDILGKATKECSDRTYGAPRTHRWLLKQGFVVGHNRVARIMAVNGWEGETGRRKVRTTIVDRGATAAEDRVKRDFSPTRPDSVWCGDITYLRTGEGWLFLATVIDLYSRRVIGWSLAAHLRTELVADALKMAIATRSGTVAARVVFHSDRGSQYTSADFGELCDEHGVLQSMGATGVCRTTQQPSRSSGP